MSELKPCPFCGGEAQVVNRFGDIQHLFYVLCDDCAACGSLEKNEAEAADAWNTRHVETCTIERNECGCNFAYRLYTLSCGHTVWTTGDAPNYCPTCGKKVEG